VTGVAFSPDGKRIVTCSEDRTVKVWDAQGGLELLTLKEHSGGVAGVALSPDGKRLVAGGYKTTLWDADRSQTRPADERGNPAGFASAAWPLPDADERIRYHTEQAAVALQQKQWFAAEFHLERVLRDDPEVATVQRHIAALLEERCPALLQEHDEAGLNAERVAVAQLAYRGKQFAVATRLWATALESDPRLGHDRQAQYRYQAARAAALASASRSKDVPPLDDAAAAKLRGQALDWLKAELTVWHKEQTRPAIVKTLRQWQQESDLAGIRDQAALAKLPAAEQKALTQLWADAAALLKKAETPADP
jgi:hypothetical protein